MIVHKPRPGLTAIELVVAVGISTIITAGLISLYKATYETYGFSTTSGTLQINTRGAVDRISRQIRESASVTSSNGGYTTGASTLILQIPAIDASNTIISSSYDYVVYRVDPAEPTTVQEIVVADPNSARTNETRTLLNNVASVSFSYYDSAGTTLTNNYANTKRIRFQINAQQNRYGRTIPITYSEQAVLRNK